ncbi:MAG TPA: SLC13 family permease, partial [Paracoccaceae bacterium]|nr:SLC13 family permease [Paracoccaceae bacterium]
MPIFEMTVVLLLFAAAAVLLATEIIPIEVTALCIVVVLAGTGIMTTAEALQGFASEAIVVLACVMILAHRLSESGATSGLSARMVGQGKRSPAAILVRLMASAASLSSVFSNTSTTAVMMPIAIDAAKKANTSPGRFLMPMAFASIMGGSATLIGTSANMAANGVITRMGLEPFRLFEFFWIGLTVSVAGIVTFVLLGNRVVPSRVSTDDSEVQDDILLAGIVVPEGSKAIDTTVKKLGLDDIGATPLAVDSEGGRLSAHPNRKIHEGDYILLRATNAALARLMGDKRFQVDGVDELSPAQVSAQAILLPGSRWIGMSVAVMRRQLGQDVAVIGVKRAG